MTKKYNPDTLGIWIVTYNRPDELNSNIRSLRRSLGPDYEINILSNHSDLKLYEDYGNVRVHMNPLRPDESWGYLSRNWNQCYYLGLDRHENILCTQDDMFFEEGWLDVVNENPQFEFFSAPIGDLAHLTSRMTFLTVGWWDERFVGIDYQDFDYVNRVYHNFGRCASVADRGYDITWNDVGLQHYWIGKGYVGGEGKDRPRGVEKIHNRMNRILLGAKKGLDVSDDHMCHKTEEWRSPGKPTRTEIDWYPWFTAKMQRVTGYDQAFMDIPFKNAYPTNGYNI